MSIEKDEYILECLSEKYKQYLEKCSLADLVYQYIFLKTKVWPSSVHDPLIRLIQEIDPTGKQDSFVVIDKLGWEKL